MVLNFVVTLSLTPLCKPPSEEIQRMVESIREPEGEGDAVDIESAVEHWEAGGKRDAHTVTVWASEVKPWAHLPPTSKLPGGVFTFQRHPFRLHAFASIGITTRVHTVQGRAGRDRPVSQAPLRAEFALPESPKARSHLSTPHSSSAGRSPSHAGHSACARSTRSVDDDASYLRPQRNDCVENRGFGLDFRKRYLFNFRD